MAFKRLVEDLKRGKSPVTKIIPQKSILSEGSLLRKENKKIITDITLTRAQTTFIGKPIPKLQKQTTRIEQSLDAITMEERFPISIPGADNSIISKLGRLFPIREIIIISVIVLVSLQGTFLINAGLKFKTTLFDQTLAGIAELRNAKDEFSQAKFTETLQHFLAAQTFFDQAHHDVTAINGGMSALPNSLITMSNDLLGLGTSIAAIGGNITKSLDILLTTQNFKLALPELKKAQNTFREASVTLANIETDSLPTEYQNQFAQIQADLPIIRQGLDFFDTITPALLRFTADGTTKRYLLMLQNTTERRGTGGFMGSFVELTFQNGRLLSAVPKDVYTVDWQQFERKAAPQFLQPYMKGLALRDANYNADFYEASKDINWAYENSRQGSLDGIIAIDQTIVPYLLDIIGPVYLPEFKLTLTKENYFVVLQYYIETNKDDPTTPKRILLSFIHEVSSKLNNIEAAIKLVQFIPQFIQERHIQMAFFDKELEQVAEKYELSGRLQSPTENLDYLHINAINVGGNKGDGLLVRNYQRTVNINPDGQITVTLTGTWKHQWSAKMESEINLLFPKLNTLSKKLRDNFWYVIGRSQTKHALRFFIPKGSVLTNNRGLNYEPTIGEENGYQVWYSEVDVPMGGEKAFTIAYNLPFTIDTTTGDTYRFLFQKQAGAGNETLDYQVLLDPELQPLANYPSSNSQGPSSQTISTDLNTDKYFELLVRKK